LIGAGNKILVEIAAMGYKLLCFALNSPKHKSRKNTNDAGK
jgi:hypothetical protein